MVISREREFSRAGEIMNTGRCPKSNVPGEELNTTETSLRKRNFKRDHKYLRIGQDMMSLKRQVKEQMLISSQFWWLPQDEWPVSVSKFSVQ